MYFFGARERERKRESEIWTGHVIKGKIKRCLHNSFLNIDFKFEVYSE